MVAMVEGHHPDTMHEYLGRAYISCEGGEPKSDNARKNRFYVLSHYTDWRSWVRLALTVVTEDHSNYLLVQSVLHRCKP